MFCSKSLNVFKMPEGILIGYLGIFWYVVLLGVTTSEAVSGSISLWFCLKEPQNTPKTSPRVYSLPVVPSDQTTVKTTANEDRS